MHIIAVHVSPRSAIATSNYVVKARVPTIILLFKISEDVDNLYKMEDVLVRRPLSDKGLCAETSAIYTNHQYLNGFYTNKNHRQNTCLNYITRY